VIKDGQLIERQALLKGLARDPAESIADCGL
jgi:hypothetical protein